MKGRLVRLVPGSALVLASLVAIVLLLPARSGDLWFSYPPSSLFTSSDATVYSASSQVSFAALPVLDAGRYEVSDAGDRVGGRWWPSRFSVVVVGSSSAAPPPAPVLVSSRAVAALAGLLVIAVLAVLWVLRRQRRWLVAFAGSFLIWLALGTVSVTAAQTVGLALLVAVVCAAGVVSGVDRRGLAVLVSLAVVAGLSSTLWVPRDSSAPSPALSAGLCASLSPPASFYCWAAVAAQTPGLSTSTADSVIFDVLRGVPPRERLDACRYVGFAVGKSLAAGAEVPNGVREVFRDLSDVCDFSLLHGVAAGSVSFPAGSVESISAVCAPAELAGLDPESFMSQCWHGAGQGVARLSRLSLTALADFCTAAPTDAARVNCAEGGLVELVDAATLPTWGVSTPEVASACLSWPSTITSQCWRYVAWSLATQSGSVSESLAGWCSSAPASEVVNCWRGMGEAAILDAGPVSPDVGFALSACLSAPAPAARWACQERVLTLVVSRALSETGSAGVEALCLDLPLVDRTAVCPAVRAFAQQVSSKGSSVQVLDALPG